MLYLSDFDQKAFDAVSSCFLFTKLAGFWLNKWVMRLLQIEEPVDNAGGGHGCCSGWSGQAGGLG